MNPGYQSGFCNEFASEALPGALPEFRNSPQRCPYGLYAEQFSGTGFTVPRHANRRSWLYRIRPAAVHGSYRRIDSVNLTAAFDGRLASPNQYRWNPPPIGAEPSDFIEGMATIGGTRFAARPERLCDPLVRREPFHAASDFSTSADGEMLDRSAARAAAPATELGASSWNRWRSP